MADRSFLDWPFFEQSHRDLARKAEDWAAANVAGLVDHHDVDGTCRRLVAAMGKAGFLAYAAPQDGRFDVRSLCILRETFARFDGLADFAFAMQGLGTGALTLYGSDAQKASVLPGVRDGTAIAAFALTEPEAGSDVAEIALAATPVGNDMVRLDGEKTWISNGGIADHYVVFARTGEAPGAKGLSAFCVPAATPGLTIAERLETIAPHPLARLRFDDCRVPASNRIGEPGAGFRIAMATLDVFRTTVGAAALGFARRALDVTLERARSRKLFGAPLADMQLTQTALAEMATAIDSAALLVYRAAWTRDSGAPRITREAAMAKMVATENAQGVIDRAVQLHGGEGVRSGSVPETLYREIRALRIYEGATEVQKLIIARQLLSQAA
ncbi:acyl-CoA dehydrogenase family protein [Aurantimonas manganoxydans]|uniref:Acyl-CoA dehydrogenase domain-containing protein n=1 Tax=Aurantimonas manganoxydans TaxID=651183 RepID=A0A0P0Z594_9HYPH|nr:acyl-CoA dehydrogenase family protein [Aurantimonas manganoxydans]BAT29342.1 acyl-CoA dehydrogenase domain-containing protein [Aurantimonas manganoxydans SI85-9A1]